MTTSDPTKRMLTEFGEPEEFFGFTLGDLKLLLPALFVGMLVIGNMPAEFGVLGWGIGGGLVLGTLIIIYASPGYQSTQAWLTDRIRYLLQPSVLTHNLLDSETEQQSTEFCPEIDDQQELTQSGVADLLADRLPGSSQTTSTQDLTDVDRFHITHRAGERTDGYLFGAVQVHPANMALATQADWEQAVRRFGDIVNGIEFPFQIYSTVTPVDPERITSGYRERFNHGGDELPEEFRALVQAYTEKLPREFARRGTSIREFYIIVPISVLDVQRDTTPVNEAGVLAKLEDLSYIGGFVTTLRARRTEASPAELEAKQVAELDHRLATIEEEIARLDGCSTTRLSTSELAALLKDFWEPASWTDDDPTPTPRSTPVVVPASGTSSDHASSTTGGNS